MFDGLKLLFETFGVEAVIFCVVAYYMLDGYYRGFIRLGLETIGLVLASAIGLLAYRTPAVWLVSRLDMSYLFAAALCFLAAWAIVIFAWSLVSARLRRRMPVMMQSATWNHRLGTLAGACDSVLLIGAILTVLMAFPLPSLLRARITNSPIAGPILGITAKLDVLVRGVVDPSSIVGLNMLAGPRALTAVEPLRLHFVVVDAPVDIDAEREMFELVNRERRAEGLAEFRWSDDLGEIARLHSEDMMARGYFGHVDPEGNNPADRAEHAAVPYGVIGENLAFAPNTQAAHEGLMHSPEHRKNILDPRFKHVGIGVVDGGDYGKVFTQEFSD